MTDEAGDFARNEFGGSADDVVQAGAVNGGVHFHGARPRAAWPPPRQLPADVRGYVNRTEELQRLNGFLNDHLGSDVSGVGLCVVTGTAGVGKTSLAVHWAHRVSAAFPDGQLYVNLRGYDPGPPVTPAHALDHFLRSLRDPGEPVPADLESRAAAYRSMLAGRRVLVLLDNASDVAQVRPLLPGTAGCLVVITSRSRLAGLVARDGAHRLVLDVLTEPQALELLHGVTDTHRPPDDPAQLVELAGLCAHLPLALRIAGERAGRRPHLPLRQLIEELRDESSLWDALTSDADEDGVRTVFAWSYRALTPDAGKLFRRLGLHTGAEFGACAAAALVGADVRTTRRLLDDLVGAHLVEQIGPDRFQFHDLLRAYATDQARVDETPESARAALRDLLLWYLRSTALACDLITPHAPRSALLGEHAAPTGPAEPPAFADLAEALRWLEVEHANLVVAVRHADESGMLDLAWLLHAALRPFHARSNRFEDWLETGAIALRAVRGLGDRVGEAEVLESLGKALVQRGRAVEGIERHRESLAIRRALGDRWGQMVSANAIGLALLRDHRLSEALAAFEQARATAAELDNPHWIGLTTANTAEVHCHLGDFETGRDLLTLAAEVFRARGDRINEAESLHGRSRAHRELGDLDAARQDISAALAVARDEEHPVAEAFWLVESGRVEVAAGRPERALVEYQRSAAMHRKVGDREREAVALDATGEAYARLGRVEDAERFHRGAVVVLRELGNRWQLAVALVNLAAVVDDPAEALAEAGALAAGFPDPEARALRERAARLAR
ncbi:tetratricopeptide repeat protein [Actinosynnema pretiosum subsp. pretiosum]|uniref:Tetratricopeptide repeat protein n=1 Tax=Actinosynnema pretiosum subsp. pretiosum TaxID=103721 RepID=A0AA45L3E7_9PSEU|nr:transcriptional regulator, SARP family [Actinosynnema pretiosum subsp. pretiosum]QUF02617.1 tetratricopeptide repeat protein [Actinosynnema pretiosum subsp. pretiosum]